METEVDKVKKKIIFSNSDFSSQSVDVWIPAGFFTLNRINFGDEEKKKKKDDSAEISAFDIETNGKQIFFGMYDGRDYKYVIIKKPTDVEKALSMLTSKTYFYGDYDLPVLLSNHVSGGNVTKFTKKSFGENFFFFRSFDVRRFKNYYRIVLGSKSVSAINLLQFYSESLYSAYVRFYQQIREIGLEVFDEKTLKEWKEDKERRKDFDKLDFEDKETIDDIARYNRLDVIATYQLAILKNKLFGIDVKTTLPSTSIS